ncbi:membrane glycosyltransferase [Oryzisolibacter propanilivorax]|uniref:Glucans biosynthesis glucosyltransferase H n=1 Tax=Oryzisolibacter propanilivorax TaxID=1527607 RepID=A0A1G9VF48_9BURK|nr:glucans biosynthesis glucosyltransferase MdoH [Oryzisolibacter propanilivorax]SDM70736.1 membrane glycosyltransferase [Oryzisolibacter propanilivorax]
MNLDNLPTPAAIVTDDRRHPGHGTAPPVHRGSMVPLPWRGFWNSIATALLLRLGGQARTAAAHGPAQPWQRAAARRRQVFIGLSLASTLAATLLFARLQPVYGHAWLGWLQLALFALLSAWVVTGFMTAVMGMWVLLRGDRHALSARSVAGHALAPDARSAVVMPICNEDVATVFAGLRATCESLAATGQARAFDVFVLSDSSEPATIAAERAAWEALRLQLATQAAQTQQPQPEVYYRLRRRRTQRKAGNVADFCRRWGRDYRYMVVLDADSVMSGECLVNLARLMEAHPRAGIIQTASQGVGHVTLHARAQQFAARVTGRLFTLGMQYWQLGESHYFGHNAIIRIAPFMRHCALAPLAGTGGLSGSILSHDFVEAALMRRAGWQVWLAADLDGSYEQQPPDLLAELQRDRRWCQGNLQNARLVAEPGLHPVHRAMLVTGAMAYLSAPLWLVFITLGTGLWLTDSPLVADWRALPGELLALWAWTLCILFMPRVLGVLAVVLKGEQRQFGGAASLLASALLESLLAILQAPIRMLAHSLFVLVALTGLKLDWKSPPREAAAVPWKDAAARFAPAGLAVAALAAGVALLDARALVWLLPVALPLLAAVPLTVVTSQLALGRSARERRWLLIPEEAWAPRVLRRAWLHASGRVPLAPAAPERGLRVVR